MIAAGACGGEKAVVVCAVSGRHVYMHDLAACTTVQMGRKRAMRSLAISPTELLCAAGARSDEMGGGRATQLILLCTMRR